MVVAVCGAGDVNRAACAAEAVTQRPTVAGFVVVEAFRPFDRVARSNGERFLCGEGSSIYCCESSGLRWQAWANLKWQFGFEAVESGMGWIKCLGCKGKVSDSAQACPHCGMPFTHAAPPSPSPPVISQPKTSAQSYRAILEARAAARMNQSQQEQWPWHDLVALAWWQKSIIWMIHSSRWA